MTAAGTITVIRSRRAAVDKLRAYRVVIDGRRAGKLQRGQRCSFPVPAGEHHVWVTIDWCRSPKTDVFVSEGTDVQLECAGSDRITTAVLRWMFRPARYLTLRLATS
jgi:hypothetical protein